MKKANEISGLITALTTVALAFFAYQGLYNTLIPVVEMRDLKNKTIILQEKLEKAKEEYTDKKSGYEKDLRSYALKISDKEQELVVLKDEQHKLIAEHKAELRKNEQVVAELISVKKNLEMSISDERKKLNKAKEQIDTARQGITIAYFDILSVKTSMTASIIHDYLYHMMLKKDYESKGLFPILSNGILVSILHSNAEKMLKDQPLTWRDIAKYHIESAEFPWPKDKEIKKQVKNKLLELIENKDEFSKVVTFDPDSTTAVTDEEVTSKAIIHLSTLTSAKFKYLLLNDLN